MGGKTWHRETVDGPGVVLVRFVDPTVLEPERFDQHECPAGGGCRRGAGSGGDSSRQPGEHSGRRGVADEGTAIEV
jgi:hypothetical protein